MGESISVSPTASTRLRPIERTMLKLAAGGMTDVDIAWRFRRTPGHIRRVLELSRIRREPIDMRIDDRPDLRPIERVVLRARREGADATEIAARLRRSPRGIVQIERLAAYKLERGLAR